MCGRFAIDKDVDDLIVEYVAKGGNAQDWRASFSVAPTNSVPIVREHDGDRLLELASWGFWPSWVKDKRPHPINARLETVASNGMFRNAFAGQRCIVPMRGYFEWEQRDDGKQPHFIHGPGELLSAAGLWAARKVDEGWAVSFTIITREARDASGEVHDRMPVFLTDDVRGDWLAEEKLDDKDGMVDLLDRVSADVAATITTYEVDRRVNNARTVDRQDPSVIAPA